ncbi:MAG TPA: RagB/SusD family nutrient uptake outer membrane protein [Chitinophagales bacterium]|nr:RagB/SusD family nutrient uptake outer membrane protein [Chitinophagales bacterium]
MKTTFVKTTLILTILAVSFTSCLKDLDRTPFYGLNTESVYADPDNYIEVLAKIYAGFSTTGNQGPAGKPDIGGIDEGFSNYIRVYWNLEELPTDEAVCGWNDPGIPELHDMKWSSDNLWIKGMYYRIYFQIALANEFIRETSDESLSSHGFSAEDVDRIKGYRNEARFLRALCYYHAMSLFANVPFVTEEDLTGAFFPEQIARADLFTYIETELKDIENLMVDPKQNEYGRADKAAAWTLLAKMYLNAEVYTGQQRYGDVITYTNKVMSAGYSLESKYTNLFLADNHLSNEIIFPITSDGLHTQSYGATTFLVHAPVGGKMKPLEFGINGGWGGYRTTSSFVSLFNDTIDGRNLFFTDGQSLEINSISLFTDGYAIAKWRNVTSTGVMGSDKTGNFVDTDYPMFRLADVYLMYAEAAVRGAAGGDMGTALSLVNQLRERAYGNSSNNLSSLNLDGVFQERSKELYWEGTRRTDLIRYGKFTGSSYIWPYKGGIKEGQGVADYLALFPIPIADIVANTNLKQNPGY